jgi:hypothetical protein
MVSFNIHVSHEYVTIGLITEYAAKLPYALFSVFCPEMFQAWSLESVLLRGSKNLSD